MFEPGGWFYVRRAYATRRLLGRGSAGFPSSVPLGPGRPIIIIVPTRTTRLANCISQEWKYLSEGLSFLLVFYKVTQSQNPFIGQM